MTTAVEIDNVTVKLGKNFIALNKLSASLPLNKIVGFIGPSGAGKTTLIRSIVGRQKIAQGQISILGTRAGTASLRQHVSYMTQEVSIYDDISVADNIAYFSTILSVPKNDIPHEIERLLKTVDLLKQKNQLVKDLSGGQKQRVSLAVALIGKPKLLVLDEPTVGLDPVLREQLWQLFRELASYGTSLIISSHVMDEAERCDELLLIRNGEILAQGSPKQLCDMTGTNSVEQSFLKLVGKDEK